MRYLTTKLGSTTFLAYGPTGEWICLLAAREHGLARLAWWSLATGEAFQPPRMPQSTRCAALARRADLIAVETPSGIGIGSLTSGPSQILGVPLLSRVTKLAVSDDGHQIAISRRTPQSTPHVETQIGVYDRPGKQYFEFSSLIEVSGMAFGPDGRFLACCGAKGITIWDTRRRESVLVGSFESGGQPAFAPDGSLLAVRAEEYVQLWDIGQKRQRQSLVGHQGWVTCLAFSPDGRVLASGGLDHTVRFWDVQSGTQLKVYTWSVGPVYVLAFAPDGLTAAAGGESGDVVIWDVDV